MAPSLAALLGLGTAAALLLAVDGLCRRPRAPGRTRRLTITPTMRIRAAVGLGAGVLVQVLVGWPVAGLLVALGVVLLPPLLGGRGAARRAEARIEAVGAWAEMLRDNLGSAAGLEQAILASALAPPPAIDAQVRELAADLSRRVRLPQALDRFAAAMADPIADLVVGQLLLAATAQASQLGAALTEMAAMARQHVSIRLDVESDRAGIRTQLRMIVVTTVLLAAGLEIFRRPFMHPYDSPVGQLVLAVVGGGAVAAFVMMNRLSRFAEAPRVLAAGKAARP